MSSPEINQVLAQMRVAQAQAGGGLAAEETKRGEFGQLLEKSIAAVNETQQSAGALRTRFEQGDDGVDIAEVMVAAQKSSVSFQAMVSVRNKLVEAYKDVMSMPV